MTSATPFTGICEMQVLDKLPNGQSYYRTISRPVSFSDVAGDFMKFADDNSYEINPTVDLYIVDLKINPNIDGTTHFPVSPAAIVNTLQIYEASNAVQFENYIRALCLDQQVRPKVHVIPAGKKFQVRQLVR